MFDAPSPRLSPANRPPSRPRPARRPTGRVRALVLAAVVAATSVGCVGRLGRNDDDVTPESDRPSANNAVRIEHPSPLAEQAP